MKIAVGALLSLVLSGMVPLCAQQPLEGRQQAIVIGGGDGGGAGINGLAVGWSLSRAHCNVTIAAHLTNGGGIGAYAGGTAYLTRKIGPHSRTTHEVAKKEFELPESYNGMFVLFTNVNLAAGEYWLVLEDPHNGRFSYANWVVAIPFLISTTKGSQYLGTTNSSEISTYMPATLIRPVDRQYGYQFEVTGEPEPLLRDEEPSRATLR